MNQKRALLLKAGTRTSGPVIYWMSRDQRVQDNWALLFAQEVALQRKAPLAVIFCVMPRFLDATVRQYSFMLKGLRDVENDLAEKNISFQLLFGSPEDQIPACIEGYRAGTLVTDFDPLNIKRRWKTAVANKISSCPFYEVDAHNIVPCWRASPKQEYAAYTFRPKINRALPEFLDEYVTLQEHPYEWRDAVANNWHSIVKTLPVDQTVPEVNWLQSGEAAAEQVLHAFLEQKLPVYPDQRNDPNKAMLSNLSPYLHFGQIAAQRVALAVHRSDAPPDSKAAFLEELIVRRELSDNYCFYNPGYESFDGLPECAQKTLHAHAKDRREYRYTRDELERAETHDPYWNAAQNEMVLRGKMHGYMWMYWGKKIIEWSSTPEEAFETALYLNNRYELDGRDPNGYTGVAWCFGTHDRPWPERPIFGTVRYMNANGLKRKFDVDGYVRTMAAMERP